MVDYLNAYHLRTLLDGKVQKEQTRARLNRMECPYLPCEFIALSRFDSLRHYGQHQCVVEEIVQEAAETNQLDLALHA